MDENEILMFAIAGIMVITLFVLIWKYADPTEVRKKKDAPRQTSIIPLKPENASIPPKQQNLVINPISPQIDFVESGWVNLFVIAGWIGVFGALSLFLVIIYEEYSESGVKDEDYFFIGMIGLAACGCLFNAHILRKFEKGVHHLESIDKKL